MLILRILLFRVLKLLLVLVLLLVALVIIGVAFDGVCSKGGMLRRLDLQLCRRRYAVARLRLRVEGIGRCVEPGLRLGLGLGLGLGQDDGARVLLVLA